VFTYTNKNKDGSYENTWSVSFIGWMTLIVIVGRTCAVWSSYFLFRLCTKKDVTLRELMFISYGGMIRGAIAFGLVLKIPNDPKTFTERSAIVTTTLALVIITTMFFGTFMKFA